MSNRPLPGLDRGSTSMIPQNRTVIEMRTNTTLTAHGAVQASQSGANAASAAPAAGAVHATTSVGATAAPAGNAAVRVAGGAASGSTASTSAGTAGSTTASAHATGSVSVSAMATKAGVALKGSLFAKSIAMVGLGLAGVVLAAHTGALPQAQGTLSMVPVWSSGPTLLSHFQTGLSGGGSGGLGINLGL